MLLLFRNSILAALSLATVLILSDTNFAQKTRTGGQKKPSTPVNTTGSHDIAINKEARLQIKKWIEERFTQHDGKYYVRLKAKPKPEPNLDWEEAARKKAAEEQAAKIGLRLSVFPPFYVTEIENLDWQINGGAISPTPLQIKNNEQVESWRGSIVFIQRGKAYSRDFDNCWWTKYRDGVNSSVLKSAFSSVTVYAKNNNWYFDEGAIEYQPVSPFEIVELLGRPNIPESGEERARLKGNYWFSGECKY